MIGESPLGCRFLSCKSDRVQKFRRSPNLGLISGKIRANDREAGGDSMRLISFLPMEGDGGPGGM